VFAVTHGSQPRFTVPEIAKDVHRAVRFVRHNARQYGIDPDRIGIMGASSGGQLALLIATTGGPGDPEADDPADRESSRVQAAAVFFPPTDFLNFGEPGREVPTSRPPFAGAFDFREYSQEQGRLLPVTDAEERRDIVRRISPAQHVTGDSAPALLVHG